MCTCIHVYISVLTELDSSVVLRLAIDVHCPIAYTIVAIGTMNMPCMLM